MLAAGDVTVTLTSRKTGRHVTLRLVAKSPEGERRWTRVPFALASHVFVEDFDGEKVATFYPVSGTLFFSRHASEASQWAVKAVLRYCAGQFPGFTEVAEIAAADLCGKCGRPLSDPESIERGYGPDCWGAATGSVAVPATV